MGPGRDAGPSLFSERARFLRWQSLRGPWEKGPWNYWGGGEGRSWKAKYERWLMEAHSALMRGALWIEEMAF